MSASYLAAKVQGLQTWPTSSGFMWVLGMWIQVLMFPRQVFSPVSHLLTSMAMWFFGNQISLLPYSPRPVVFIKSGCSNVLLWVRFTNWDSISIWCQHCSWPCGPWKWKGNGFSFHGCHYFKEQIGIYEIKTSRSLHCPSRTHSKTTIKQEFASISLQSLPNMTESHTTDD